MEPKVSEHLPVKSVDFLVLISLAQGELHGYGLVQQIAEQSEHRVQLVPTNLYTVLRRLQASGLIAKGGRRATGSGDDQRRRYYRLTDLGRQVMAAEGERLGSLLRLADRQRLFDPR